VQNEAKYWHFSKVTPNNFKYLQALIGSLHRHHRQIKAVILIGYGFFIFERRR